MVRALTGAAARPGPRADRIASQRYPREGKLGLAKVVDEMSKPSTCTRPTNINTCKYNHYVRAGTRAQSVAEPWSDKTSIRRRIMRMRNQMRDDYGMRTNDRCNLYDDTDVEEALLPPSVTMVTCQTTKTLIEVEIDEPTFCDHLEPEDLAEPEVTSFPDTPEGYTASDVPNGMADDPVS